jgi:hypothetical protein
VAGGTISVGSSGAKCRFACVADLRAAGAAVAFEPCSASPTGFCLALRAALNDAVRRTRCRLLLLLRLVLGFLGLGVGGAASFGDAAAVSHTNPTGAAPRNAFFTKLEHASKPKIVDSATVSICSFQQL